MLSADEIVERIHSIVVKRVTQDINNIFYKDKEHIHMLIDKLEEKIEELRNETTIFISCEKMLFKYEQKIEKSEKALNDRSNNLQKIYDKMIIIEKKLKQLDFKKPDEFLEGKWININDRLPEENSICLVKLDPALDKSDYFYMICKFESGYYASKICCFMGNGTIMDSKITHWIKLNPVD